MKGKKQYGVWMDTQSATVVGRENIDEGDFKVIATEKVTSRGGNSNENAANNTEKTDQQKFFKEILSHMQNVEELHVTGTGQIQENLINYLSETPQYKNTQTTHCTSNKMSDEKLVEFFTEKFN